MVSLRLWVRVVILLCKLLSFGWVVWSVVDYIWGGNSIILVVALALHTHVFIVANCIYKSWISPKANGAGDKSGSQGSFGWRDRIDMMGAMFGVMFASVGISVDAAITWRVWLVVAIGLLYVGETLIVDCYYKRKAKSSIVVD